MGKFEKNNYQLSSKSQTFKGILDDIEYLVITEKNKGATKITLIPNQFNHLSIVSPAKLIRIELIPISKNIMIKDTL